MSSTGAGQGGIGVGELHSIGALADLVDPGGPTLAARCRRLALRISTRISS